VSLAFGIELDAKLVAELVARVVPHVFDATPLFGKMFLTSGAMDLLIGRVLVSKLRHCVLTQVLRGGHFPEQTFDSLSQELVTELVDKQHRLLRLQLEDERMANSMKPDVGIEALNSKRSKKGVSNYIDVLTVQTQFAIDCHIALSNMPKTVAEAEHLLGQLGRLPPPSEPLESIASRWSLGRHALVVDSALDVLVARKIEAARQEGRFFGFGMCTDESPPKVRRFRGFRFQATRLYVPISPCRTEWERPLYDEQPPIDTLKLLCDMCHCPGNKGSDVDAVIDKHISRLGLVRDECHSGCGDGVGENEGSNDVHNVYQAGNQSYVRHRCLGHWGWRTADAVINVGAVHKKAQSMSSWLRDGITWFRLQAIAVQPIHSGGAHVCTEGSVAFKKYFGVSPPSVIDERPETDLAFLQWLIPKETVLALCIEKDMTQRDTVGAADVLETLRDTRASLQRCVDMDIIARSLTMYYFVKKKEERGNTKGIFLNIFMKQIERVFDSVFERSGSHLRTGRGS